MNIKILKQIDRYRDYRGVKHWNFSDVKLPWWHCYDECDLLESAIRMQKRCLARGHRWRPLGFQDGLAPKD
jgi:hypothetical protein